MTATVPESATFTRDGTGELWIEWKCCPTVDHTSKVPMQEWMEKNCVPGTDVEVMQTAAGEIVAVVLSTQFERRSSVTSRRFRLFRHEDVSEVSGTGVIAHGVQWPDGTVALRWAIPDMPPSTALWESIEAVEAIHGHQGKTVVEWVD